MSGNEDAKGRDRADDKYRYVCTYLLKTGETGTCQTDWANILSNSKYVENPWSKSIQRASDPGFWSVSWIMWRREKMGRF